MVKNDWFEFNSPVTTPRLNTMLTSLRSNLHSERSASGPQNHATRKVSNLHSETSAAGPRQHPQTPGATQHEGDQTFTRKQKRPDPVVDSLKQRNTKFERGQTFTRKSVLLDPVANTPQPSEQCHTKGVKPSLGNTCFRTPSPTPPNCRSNTTRKG